MGAIRRNQGVGRYNHEHNSLYHISKVKRHGPPVDEGNEELTNVPVANISVTGELIRHVTIVIACGSESAPAFAGVGLAGFGRANPRLLY